jgi:hypothetical protein
MDLMDEVGGGADRESWLIRFRWPVVGGWCLVFAGIDLLEGRTVHAAVAAVMAVTLPVLLGSRWFRTHARKNAEKRRARSK